MYIRFVLYTIKIIMQKTKFYISRFFFFFCFSIFFFVVIKTILDNFILVFVFMDIFSRKMLLGQLISLLKLLLKNYFKLTFILSSLIHCILISLAYLAVYGPSLKFDPLNKPGYACIGHSTVVELCSFVLTGHT